MKISNEEVEFLEFEILENRSLCEHSPLNLVRQWKRGYCEGYEIGLSVYERMGKEVFIDYVWDVLDENE
jgi:hypothetical protein